MVKRILAAGSAAEWFKQDVPCGSLLFNAPRPLIGALTFTGKYLRGVYYAAVDPTDTESIARNEDLDARLVVFKTADELRGWAFDAYGDEALAFGFDEIVAAYRARFA